MKSKKQTLLIGFTLGLGWLLALSWLMISGASQVGLAQSGSGTIRVAITGSDTPGCGSLAAPCQTLQYAVDQALAGDEIRVATGSYIGVQSHAAPGGYPYPPASGNILQIVYISKAVTIRGGYTAAFNDPPDPQANPTTLDAQGSGRAMVIAGNVSPTIQGLRLTGGNANGLGGGMDNTDGGGGLYIINATAIFSNNVVYENSADSGGGIFLENSLSTLSENEIFSNTVLYFGGGVLLHNSAATLNGNTLNANTATSNLGSGAGINAFNSSATIHGNTVYSNIAQSNGGGIYLNTSPNATLVANTIMSNTANAGYGGGIWMRYGDGSRLSTNTIRANEAPTNSGGGLYIDQSHAILEVNTIVSNTAYTGGGLYLSGREITMTANMVLSNTALIGGGIYMSYNDSTLTANTIRFNQATLDNGEGGGIFIYYSDPVLNRNIITYNYADWGGGVGVFRSSPTLINTVVADNTAGQYGSGLNIRRNSSPRLWHSTIARNRGGDGTGVLVTGTNCSVSMTNTIVISHTLGISVSLNNTVYLAGTLWYSNTADWGGAGAIFTGTHNYWGDPLFATDGFHLTPGSMAIDHGLYAGVADDIDDEARLGIPDLGADELAEAHLFLPMIVRQH
jgi:parallel beta-helix repeat protein